MDVMAATNEVLMADRVAERTNPIEFQTENGFSIIRLSDIDDSVPALGIVHRFLVRDQDGFELDITVEIAETVAQELVKRSRGRLIPESSYWLSCAERHLVNYLWENGDYPPDARLIVDQTILDDLDLALRWDKKTP
jgi:hypothetical protein